jgi:hypothetical protein
MVVADPGDHLTPQMDGDPPAARDRSMPAEPEVDDR